MMGPAWAGWAFVLAFMLIAVHCAARLVIRRQVAGSDEQGTGATDLTHLLLALGMAAMFLPVGDPIPLPWGAALFGVVALYWLVAEPRHRAGAAGGGITVRGPGLHHVVESLAMVYMFLAGSGGAMATDSGTDMPGMAGMSRGPVDVPALTWVFAFYFLAHLVWSGIRAIEPATAPGSRGVLHAAPVLTAGRLVMGVGMTYTLLAML
ncbi:DUF5134 domain-containing protein [Pseudonocardia acidicola]|uniref:DUF5134 domain-containing protein n=1 Tax=Pseudonocardia acidicola TaxID=2724939 RepID=A0ABX1SHY6_9PSEU|nr:DUF5134 domain-containing protein [Pseudonocardia acidicola]NMI01200.1 DUF5134 domain-containing protein [Pseudonocardia acidicola]